MFAFAMPGFPEIAIIAVFGIFAIAVQVVFVFCVWKICTKAGFPGWYGLAVVLPGLNLVLLFFLAFAEWPALRQSNGFDK